MATRPQIKVRLSPELLARLREVAQASGRTLSAEIEQRLAETLHQDLLFEMVEIAVGKALVKHNAA